jgi:hypothetical protein
MMLQQFRATQTFGQVTIISYLLTKHKNTTQEFVACRSVIFCDHRDDRKSAPLRLNRFNKQLETLLRISVIDNQWVPSGDFCELPPCCDVTIVVVKLGAVDRDRYFKSYCSRFLGKSILVHKVNQKFLCINIHHIDPCSIVSHIDYLEMHFFHHYILYRSVYFLNAAGRPNQTLPIFAKPFHGAYHLYPTNIKTMVRVN